MTVFEPMLNFQDVRIECSRDLACYQLATEDYDNIRGNKLTTVRKSGGQIPLHESRLCGYHDLFLASQHSSPMTHLLYLDISSCASMFALYTLLDQLIGR